MSRKSPTQPLKWPAVLVGAERIAPDWRARGCLEHLVYEPDIAQVKFAFPQRLACGGLRSFVAAPLLVESEVFGVLIAARRESHAFSSGECEFLKQLSEHAAFRSSSRKIKPGSVNAAVSGPN